jgi:hypothetical protein
VEAAEHALAVALQVEEFMKEDVVWDSPAAGCVSDLFAIAPSIWRKSSANGIHVVVQAYQKLIVIFSFRPLPLLFSSTS